MQTIATLSNSQLQNPSIAQYTNNFTGVYNNINQYLVSPVINLGIAGIQLDIPQEHKVEYDSEITDHYTEAGFTINDNVIIKPLRFSMTGRVGEFVNSLSQNQSSAFQQLTQKLTVVNSFIPILTNGMKQLQQSSQIASQSNQQTSNYVQATIGAATNFYSVYKKLTPPNTRQAQVVNFLRALQVSKMLVSIQSPWSFFSNLLIENLSIVQTEHSVDYTEISITFKEIRQATLQYTNFNSSIYQSRAANQASTNVLVGQSGGSSLNPSQKQQFNNSILYYAANGQSGQAANRLNSYVSFPNTQPSSAP